MAIPDPLGGPGIHTAFLVHLSPGAHTIDLRGDAHGAFEAEGKAPQESTSRAPSAHGVFRTEGRPAEFGWGQRVRGEGFEVRRSWSRPSGVGAVVGK
jgi:hypothetical protein